MAHARGPVVPPVSLQGLWTCGVPLNSCARDPVRDARGACACAVCALAGPVNPVVPVSRAREARVP